MRLALPIALLLLLGACRPEFIGTTDIDTLEARLSLTPSQRPAWDDFRKEIQKAKSRWSSDFAPGRQQLRAALTAPQFDRSRALQAAGEAARQGYADAESLINAWGKIDATLTKEQRQELRRSPPL